MVKQEVTGVGTAANIVALFAHFPAGVGTAATTTHEIQEAFVLFWLFELAAFRDGSAAAVAIV